MFLKKLEINGFKSFAKPIKIDFESPIIAIVGPNGSGKSNIVDAIRWVLGEQSAKTLRGSHMVDVIFAGSDDHKPLHKASVTLYLDNTEHLLPVNARKVKICRRVNDNGQSEYLLNDVVCRLRDIEEILMDTGMGKDSYSIIGQGKIDSILNSKPELLRGLFEEAAGISKHKLRKEEAEKSLERTNQDLQRVKDLIWELEKQFTPLKKAAEKAQKYQHLQGELKVLEVNLLLDNWNKNKNELVILRENKLFSKNRLDNLEAKLNKLKTVLEEKQTEMKEEEYVLENLQDDYYHIKFKKEEVENRLEILNERINSLNREKRDLDEQNSGLFDLKVNLIDQRNRSKNQLVYLKEEEMKNGDVLDTKESLLEEKRKILNNKKQDLFSLRNLILNDNMELKGINMELEKAKEKGYYLGLEIERMIKKKKDFMAELDKKLILQKQLKQDLVSIENELEEAKNEFHQANLKELELAESFANFKDQFEEAKGQLTQQNSRLKILLEMKEDYEGYYRGVKSIFKSDLHLPGLIGVVADQMNLAKEYELAIETALGSRLQNIIVKDDETARQAIKFLRKKKGGRATFLPLNMVKGNKARVDKLGIEEIDGYLGLASDFISCENYLNPVINYLLGRTIIASNLKKASEIAKKINSSLKIVTLDGNLINSGGAITGGSINKNRQGFLGRSRKIEELKKKIAFSRKEIEHQFEEGNRIKDKLVKIKDIQEGIKQGIHQLELKKNSLYKDLTNNKKDQFRLERQLNELNQDFIEYHNQLGINNSKMQKLEKKIGLINDDYSNERKGIEFKEKELKKLEKEEQEFNQEITKLKVEFATLVQNKNNLLQEGEKIELEFRTTQEKIKLNQERLNKVVEDLLEIKTKESKLKEMGKEFRAKTLKFNQQYRDKDRLIKEKRIKIDQLQEKLQKNQNELNEVMDKNHKIDLKLIRLGDKNEQIKERLWGGYEVDPDLSTVKRIKINNYTQIVTKINEFKDAIKGLGMVNQGAIQEFANLKSRLDYLHNQDEDLLEARKSIIKLVKEVEEKMSNLFYETFIKVKNEFESIFKKLFEGGQAELRLTQAENLLKTGVEIVAQPPGKQLKKLSLMSGGERALTAIALVFAFLKVNPSPFYILDEIDAPLDDANIARFTRFIKEYSHFVQFLIITHHKTMMTVAEYIYGVTMEESGISKLISLKLDEEIA